MVFSLWLFGNDQHGCGASLLALDVQVVGDDGKGNRCMYRYVPLSLLTAASSLVLHYFGLYFSMLVATSYLS